MTNSILKTDVSGTKYWENEQGQFHREDGPAWISNMSKQWIINDKLHREDGPAIEFISGDKEYWYYGQYIDCKTDEEFQRLIKLKAFW